MGLGLDLSALDQARREREMEGPARETQQFPMPMPVPRPRVRQKNCAGALESWNPILDACNRCRAAACPSWRAP